MPSGKKTSPRVLLAAGGVVLAVAVAVVLALVLTGGGKKVPAVGAIVEGPPGAVDVDTLFRAIPQRGITLGSADAPVTMTMYADLQCVKCQKFAVEVLPRVIRSFVRSGKVKVELRPWAFVGDDSVRGETAVIAAAQQNKAFNLAELLYFNQQAPNGGWLTDDLIRSAASGIPGLRVPQFLDDLKSDKATTAVASADRLAQNAGVKKTLNVFVGKSGTPGTQVEFLRLGEEWKTVRRDLRAELGLD